MFFDWQPDRRTFLQPDLLVVEKDHIGGKNISETPALVVEVLSPSSSRYGRTMKLSRYAEAGVSRSTGWSTRSPSTACIGPHRGLRPGRGRSLPADCRSEGDREISVTAPIPVSVSASALV